MIPTQGWRLPFFARAKKGASARSFGKGHEAMKKKSLVRMYINMWPRDVFDMKEGRRLLVRCVPELGKTGVYILYRDEHPHYIGKASRSLFHRLHDHANKCTDKYFNLWNYFSAFVVDRKHLGEVEALLIAAMPTANSSVPRIQQVKIPVSLRKNLRAARQERFV